MGFPISRFPIKLPVNCRIWLTRETGVFTTDPLTGDEIPDYETIYVEACINTTADAGKVNQFPGANVGDSFVRGYTINPKILPEGCLLDGTIKCEYIDSITQSWRKAELTILPLTSMHSLQMAQLHGTPFRAILKMLETSQ